MLTLIYTKSIKIGPSVIGYIAKSVAFVGKGRKHDGYREFDVAFKRFHAAHATFVSLIKVCISCARTWFPLSLSHYLGYHPIYGRRARRCDILLRRPHRYRALELAMPHGQGTWTVHHHTLNSITDVCSRHTCISCLETRIWIAATTRAPFNHLSVHESKWDVTPLDHSWWPH